MIFVNPDARSNRDVPNMGLAYIATVMGVPVVDLNTDTQYPDRYLDQKTDVLAVSVQSRSASEFTKIKDAYLEKYAESRVCSVTGVLDIQCCYPYLDMGESIQCEDHFSDDLPFPDFSLFDSYPAFVENWSQGTWHYSIMTSHGCPFGCQYCASRSRHGQARSPENCVVELEYAQLVHSVRCFQILDDCFNADPERVMEFCRLVGRLRMPWRCANGLRADRFDEDMAAALKEAGCTHVNFGIESADPAVLQEIQKGESLDDIERAVRIARQYFGTVAGYFIIGLPGSSMKSDFASLEWAKKQGIHGFFSFHVPMEESGLTQDALFYGDEAHPLSTAYPAEEQLQVYQRSLEMEGRSTSRLKSLLAGCRRRLKSFPKG